MRLNGTQIIIKLLERQGISQIGADAAQEADTFGLMSPITKQNWLVHSAEGLLEGTLCRPMEGQVHSRIWLLVPDDQQLEQIIHQTQKLQDVINIRKPHGVDHRVFIQLEATFN